MAKRGLGQYFRVGPGADTLEDTMPSIICDALCNLVPFAQFKKRERHPWRSNFTKSNTPPWVFSRFLNCTNDIKSRKTSHLVSVNLSHIIFLLVFPVLCQLLVWSENSHHFLYHTKYHHIDDVDEYHLISPCKWFI